MKRTTVHASKVLVCLLLVACNDAVGPRASLSSEHRPRMSSEFTVEQISYLLCGWDWNNEIVCELRLSTGGIYPALRKAAWSPDALKIAGESDWHIGVITLADGSLTMLTEGPANDLSPTWSPDGDRIAFVSDRDGAWDIYTMNAVDGSGVVRLTNGAHVAAFQGNPDWSPDGSRLLFDCEIEAGNGDLCAINADGSGLVRLTTQPGPDSDGDWSADGTKILFASSWYITVMNADGSNWKRLATGLEPVWSPGGSRIAFSVPYWGYCEAHCEGNVYVMNADGTNGVRFASGSQPAWRPAAGDTPPPPDQPPVASFFYSCVNLKCDFHSTSYDDHLIASQVLNFGDGTPDSQGGSGWYGYAAPGIYVVTLTVRDELGQTSSVSHSVTVPVAPTPPQIWGSCTYLTCQFALTIADSYIVSQLWTFADGTSSTELNPKHIYATAGTYQVSATVTNGYGQTSTASSLTVIATTPPPPPPPPPDQPPVARFTFTCAGTSCTFNGSSSTDDLGIASYSWSLGTAGAANGAVVTAKFKGRASQTVTLTVRDTKGQANSTTQTVSVK